MTEFINVDEEFQNQDAPKASFDMLDPETMDFPTDRESLKRALEWAGLSISKWKKSAGYKNVIARLKGEKKYPNEDSRADDSWMLDL